VERFNRVLKEGIKAEFCDNVLFKDVVNHVLANYRSTVNCTSGYSPAFLMFGREMLMPLNKLSPSVVVKNECDKIVQFKGQQRKKYYDRRYRVKDSTIEVGDFVKIREQRRQHKLQPDFSHDSYEVVKLLGKNAIRLADGRVWNLCDCLLFSKGERDCDDDDDSQLVDFSSDLVEEQAPSTPVVSLRRSQRSRKPKVTFSP
jgi:ribosomal protein S17